MARMVAKVTNPIRSFLSVMQVIPPPRKNCARLLARPPRIFRPPVIAKLIGAGILCGRRPHIADASRNRCAERRDGEHSPDSSFQRRHCRPLSQNDAWSAGAADQLTRSVKTSRRQVPRICSRGPASRPSRCYPRCRAAGRSASADYLDGCTCRNRSSDIQACR
jgi:hypothetical protein